VKIIRVFPRKIKATPDDENAVIGEPGLFHEADQILVDCTFTWDKPEAERLAEAWKKIAPVSLSGVAYGDILGEFIPGKFLKLGYTITSRGCNNRCWFCYVWKHCKGRLTELEIKDGWIVQDDNLLACSEPHINAVFEMLKRQPKRAVFSGGIEARLLKDWHVNKFVELKPQQIFFAYDTEDDFEPLVNASKLLQDTKFLRPKYRTAFCYVLIGYPNDTFEKAERRLRNTANLGFMPFAMLYRDDSGIVNNEWKRFQRLWTRPAIIEARMKNEYY
jgi:hypothetical protein